MHDFAISRITVQITPAIEQPHEIYRLPAPEVPAFELEGPFEHRDVKPAKDNGWTLTVKYARGPWKHSTQENYKMVHYVSALFVRGDLRVAAIWTADVNKDAPKYTFHTAIRNDQLGQLGAKELTALLKTAPSKGP